jgi:hypothetical protein
MRPRIRTFDIDGVIYLNKDIPGLRPEPNDFIITGRSFEEEVETKKMLERRQIHNIVFFNPLPFDEKTRITSGQHKGHTLNKLKEEGHQIIYHIEDDEVQIQEIKKIAPWVTILHLVHDLTEKENVRHVEESI